jgi:mono/diheme cytochrome c family protein
MLPMMLLLAQSAAPAPAAPGEKVFLTTCAVGYCHGVGGAANRGPRLRGRSFEAGYVERTVRHGIPNSAMPAFETKLAEPELSAVVRYVESIAAPGASVPPSTAAAASHPAAPMPADAVAGRSLFQDATRENRCAVCHQVRAGEPKAGPDLAASHHNPQELIAAVRGARSSQVRRAVLRSGEAFSVRVASETPQMVRVFDLSVLPPVLRTLRREDLVSLEADPGWSHARVASGYSEDDLAQIARYLAWQAEQH